MKEYYTAIKGRGLDLYMNLDLKNMISAEEYELLTVTHTKRPVLEAKTPNKWMS